MENNIKFKEIRIRKTFSMCSDLSYSMVIHNNGLVYYSDDGFEEDPKERSYHIREEALSALDQAVEEYSFFDLKKQEYTDAKTCHPWVFTQVEMQDGRVREIDDYKGVDDWPAALDEFEDEVVRIVMSNMIMPTEMEVE